jgi:hypothetical protein
MSQVIDLCSDSDSDGERPNSASVPSLLLSRKRTRDKEETLNANDAEFVVDVELADGVEIVSHYHKKRRGRVMRSQRIGTDEAAENCAQILILLNATEKGVGSEVAQVAGDHRESHEGITAAAAASRLRSRVAWEDRLIELADYCKVHGHCNVPQNYNENSKLASWVRTQRDQYRLQQEGKMSSMTTLRIQQLESLGFEWRVCIITWEDRLSELADYRKVHGHCNVPHRYSKNPKLGEWVGTQRTNYKLRREGKTPCISAIRIQVLERLGFQWIYRGTTWEKRLSELADYHKTHGHCNVPRNYSENSKLANWVAHQRKQYRLHREGKTSAMTTFRIQELERLCFAWRVCVTTWEDRLNELADYRKIHGHCNVPSSHKENAKLAYWVANQRKSYWMHIKGKASHLTLSRIQELESLGFDTSRRREIAKKPSLVNDARRVHKKVANSRQETAPFSNEIMRATGYY